MGHFDQRQKAAKTLCTMLTESFHVLTATLLSILIPLAFLLLARASSYRYLWSIESDPTSQPEPDSLILSFVLQSNTALVCFIVSIFSIATLVHSLTGRFNLLNYESERRRLVTAWFLLCTLQCCVGFGVQSSVASEIDEHSFDTERSLLRRIIFFLGLHETMFYWSRIVVRPVVDDTAFGFARDERLSQRVCVALSYGVLWWWRLRDEVESLVTVTEEKREMVVGDGADVADLVGWWLYYLTATIGIVRVVKGILWVLTILVFRRARWNISSDPSVVDDKV